MKEEKVMCIYFGNSPELTYKNREHIFLASTGGTVTLPQSYVSDQAISGGAPSSKGVPSS